MSRIETVQGLVRASSLTYDEIARKAPVGRSWLDKFMQGRIVEPGLNKIERLEGLLRSESGRRIAAG